MRGLREDTQRDYIRLVRSFSYASFPPPTAPHMSTAATTATERMYSLVIVGAAYRSTISVTTFTFPTPLRAPNGAGQDKGALRVGIGLLIPERSVP